MRASALILLTKAPGPNLVVDGGFDLGISQVTAKRSATLSWDNSNSLKVVPNGVTAEPQGHLALATVPGVLYVATVQIVAAVANANIRVYRTDGTTALASLLNVGVGIRTLTFTPVETLSYLSLGVNSSSAAQSSIFDNASVRRV